MGGRQQQQPLAPRPLARKRHLAALEAVVGQTDRPGRVLPRDLEAGDAIAQLGRQVEGGLGLGLACGKRQRHPRQFALDPGGVRAMRRNFDLGGTKAGQARGGDLHRAIPEPGRAQRQHRVRPGKHPHQSVRIKRRQQRRAAGVIKTIGQPEGIKRTIGQHRHPSAQIGARKRLRDQPRQPFGHRPCGLKYRRLRRVGQPQHGHAAPRPPGLGQSRLRAPDPLRPVTRVGPGGIEQDQQRPAARSTRLGVQHRPGKADDRRRQRQRAQQQKPPRRLVGFNRVVLEPQQQRNAGKPPFDRGWRHHPQQQPQDR